MGFSPERLPILALTAAAPPTDYYSLGLNDWLTKPMLIKNIQTAMPNAICNIGAAASSVGTGSVFTGGDLTLDYGNESVTSRGCHPLSRQESFSSVYSAFSKHLLAISMPQQPKSAALGTTSCHTSTTMTSS